MQVGCCPPGWFPPPFSHDGGLILAPAVPAGTRASAPTAAIAASFEARLLKRSTATPFGSRVPYGHFFRPPVEVSLFCPAGHLPDAFVSGFPAPGPGEMGAVATPLAASAMAAANSAMRFFTAHPPVRKTLDFKGGTLRST